MFAHFRSARRRVYKGVITSDSSDRDLACQVHNASPDGATLRLSRARLVPSDFTLELDDGLALACAVIRRSQIDLCVRFVPA